MCIVEFKVHVRPVASFDETGFFFTKGVSIFAISLEIERGFM